MVRALALVLLASAAIDAGAAAVASGRNWRLTIDKLQCEAGATLVIDTRVEYLGPTMPAETPVNELADGEGRQIRPKSLVWKAGSKDLARWLPAGKMANVTTLVSTDVQLKYEVREAKGEVKLLFGDIGAFALTRKEAGKSACESLVATAALQTPRLLTLKEKGETPRVRVYRESYPCRTPRGDVRVMEANQPPQLPLQMLLFGRGYLPSTRQVDLPGGKVPAQAYAYAGKEDFAQVEDAARRAIATDFPAYRSSLLRVGDAGAKKHYAFNWGIQKSAGGNDLYPIGLYEVQACAAKM
jgi:hypothetical protein